jgi:hypothetical protein
MDSTVAGNQLATDESQTRICTDSPAQMYQNYLDKSTPYTTYRWIATATVFILFGLRIVFAQGWYIGTSRAEAHKDRRSASEQTS